MKNYQLQAAESGVIRNYIEWLVTIPWTEATEDQLDINRSEKILNRDHDGLETVKERILRIFSCSSIDEIITWSNSMFSWTSRSRENILSSFDCRIT